MKTLQVANKITITGLIALSLILPSSAFALHSEVCTVKLKQRTWGGGGLWSVTEIDGTCSPQPLFSAVRAKLDLLEATCNSAPTVEFDRVDTATLATLIGGRGELDEALDTAIDADSSTLAASRAEFAQVSDQYLPRPFIPAPGGNVCIITQEFVFGGAYSAGGPAKPHLTAAQTIHLDGAHVNRTSTTAPIARFDVGSTEVNLVSAVRLRE